MCKRLAHLSVVRMVPSSGLRAGCMCKPDTFLEQPFSFSAIYPHSIRCFHQISDSSGCWFRYA